MDIEHYRACILFVCNHLHYSEVEGLRSLTVAELDRNAQIAFNLRRLRAEKGVSQAELAKAIGNSQAFVAMIESGARTLSAPMCMDIAKALGCEVKDILGE